MSCSSTPHFSRVFAYKRVDRADGLLNEMNPSRLQGENWTGFLWSMVCGTRLCLSFRLRNIYLEWSTRGQNADEAVYDFHQAEMDNMGMRSHMLEIF